MATITQIRAALASQIQTALSGVDNLTTDPRMSFNPTAPYIDVYPGDPFREPGSFGRNGIFFLTVRARVSTADHPAAQDTLDALMDDEGSASVGNAIMGNRTLGGMVDNVSVVEQSGYGTFPGGGDESALGCTWRVRVIP